ncbi:MAG: IS1182 family transposase [Planctomycetaceae bacterium]|nr:IS1182 family transposase [Planctomycetaceae bacterium]
MILPPRPENHPRPEPPRPALGPHPRRDRPALERFAPPPWDRHSPQWLEIEDTLPADHRARAIDEAVDQLDLTDLFASSAGVGSKAHRPDLMLKIVVSEIQTGRHSPDQWAQDVHDRRSLQWLGLGITPSRTRFYAFRDRIGPRLEALNRQVLEAALIQGLTTARPGALDGTLIAANASRHRLVNLARLQRRLAELDRVIAADKIRQDPGAIPAWMAHPPATRRQQRYRFREAQRKLLKQHAQNARRSRDQRQAPEKIVISTSDCEAALGRDKEKVFWPLYNLQVVPDLESPLILGYEVFAQATDAGTLMPLRQRVHDLTGVWLERLLADAGSASALDRFDGAQAAVDLDAPYQENAQTEQRRAKRPHRVIPKSEFAWRPEAQSYVCPQGHRLSAIGQERRARAEGRSVVLTTDRCAKEHCQACPLAARCTRGRNGRTIKRNEHEDLIVAQQAKMQTSEAKAIYRQRGQTIELRFADTKAHRGLRRFSGRGLTRVRIEAGLLVLSHNLLVVQAVRERKAAEGQKGTSCQDAA